MTKLKKLLRLLQLINQLHKPPHKSVEQIGELLEVSPRSVYRYLELLELAGFQINKSEKNHYYIDNMRNPMVGDLTEEEAEFINKTLSIHGGDNKLLGSIKHKLSLVNSHVITSSYITSARTGTIVENLIEAIQSKKQVVLKKYQSLSSQTIIDRLVEPIALDSDYRTLTAFEVATKTNKTFVIERIDNVERTPVKFKNEKLHQAIDSDVFGFGTREDQQTFPVHLELSLKAKVLITEEYPKTALHIKKMRNKENYTFTCEVNDLRPIERFMRGLPGEVKTTENHVNKCNV
jgi:predicted DNA-binding transcriptional regulator YafY